MCVRTSSVIALLLAACAETPPQGLALVRVTEIDGVCPLEQDNNYGLTRIPTDLPFRRAKATAAFRESEAYPGGHFIAVGYQDPEGRVGMIQYEVPPDRGYGIAQYKDMVIRQGAGFAEWQNDQLLFAGRSVNGYLNYLSTEDGEKMPAKVYSLLAFDAKDPAGADLCRIVAIHATAQYERVTDYDVAWLEPRPGLIITSEGGALSTPALDNLVAPSAVPVAPAVAPPDPGAPARRMEHQGPRSFPDPSWGGGSPCD